MPTSPARWRPAVTVAVAVALSVLTPAPVAAETRFLSFLGGARTTPPPAVRDAPKAERQWIFGLPAKTSPWGPGADKTTEDRRRVPRPTTASATRYTATTTTTTAAPRPTTTTTTTTQTQTTPRPTTTIRNTEVTTHKPETTTSERHIISAPLHPCPEGQRMSPDRKCVDNYTDPEDRR